MRTIAVSKEKAAHKCLYLAGGGFTVAQSANAMEWHRVLLEEGEVVIKKRNIKLKLEVKHAFPYDQDQWEVLDHLEEHGHTFMRTLIKNCWKVGQSAKIDLNCASMSGIRILFTRADARFRSGGFSENSL